MNKQAISVSLDPGNLLWLKAQKARGRQRSLSAVLDGLIAEARETARGHREGVRSVQGTISIAASDPDLHSADAAVRALFEASLRPSRAKRQRATSRR